MRSLARAQHKEASARREAENERMSLEVAQGELSKLRSGLENCQKELQNLQDASSNTAANEAILRRLGNERQYIKNQLKAEIDSRNELLENVDAAENELLETKNAWKAEVGSFQEKMRSELILRENMETDHKGKNQILLAEVEVQIQHVEELKQAYAKVREQLRLEHASTEQMHATSQRLTEELNAVQDELANTRKIADTTIARHAETTRLISTSIEQADEVRSREIAKLQGETHKALHEASQEKLEKLQLRTHVMEQKQQVLKSCATQIIGIALQNIIRRDKRRFFSIWRFKVVEWKLLVLHRQKIEA